MMPRVFIIILNWNGWQDTIECLDSLKKINYPDYEIVVVDNGSTDGSADIIQKKYSQGIFFIETGKNLGFAGGNNIGIKYALERGADLILLLNNDTKVAPDFLTKLVEVAQSDFKIGIVGPKILFWNQPDRIWFGGGKINWLKTKGEHIDYRKIDTTTPSNKPKKSDYISGCCLLIKREVVDKIGLLNDDYFLYYEDTDWCLKAKEAGYKIIYVPASCIWHKASVRTKEGSPTFIYYHSRNGLALAKRHNGFLKRILLYFFIAWLYLKQKIKKTLNYKKEWAEMILIAIKDFYNGKMGPYAG